MGPSWGSHGVSMGLLWSSMRLLMGLSWSCYAAFMDPRCGLYGNAGMLAVFLGSSPSDRCETLNEWQLTTCVILWLRLSSADCDHIMRVRQHGPGHKNFLIPVLCSLARFAGAN